MSRIVTLEDNLAESSALGSILTSVGSTRIGAATPRPTPTMPVTSRPVTRTPSMPVMPTIEETQPASPPQTVYALMPRNGGPCGCGSCTRCQQQSNWGGAPPTINVTVSPNITANGGTAYSEGVRQNGLAPLSESAVPVVQTVEKPVFIDRVKEVVNEVMKPVYIPVKEIVERVKQMPLFMPFQTKTPVDRPVPMPLKVVQPVDRPVPTPLKVITPVDRPVPVPVNPVAAQRPVRPPQPFQVVKNRRNDQTGVNYFS